ncbi:MAG: ABC transporter permease [Microthrixaceae bacterium]
MLSALLRQRRRLLLATVAIALSVGYLAGALNLLDRVGRGLDDLAAAGSAPADLVIEGGIAYESPTEQVRRLVPASLEATVAQVPGVAVVSPRIEDTAPIVGPDGKTLVRLGLTEQPIGANFPADARLSPYEFVSGGPPTTSTEVAIDRRSAAEGGVEVGDQVFVVGRAGAAPYTVSGIVSTDGGGLPPGSSLALLSTAEARVRFDRPTDDNTIDILVEPGADVAQVRSSIEALLPAGIEVVDGPTGAEHRQESVDRSFTLVRSLILGFAALALVVGMVTVGNSLTLLYAERRRTFAGLRLVGAKSRQLLFAALAEAALLALLASVLGAPLGLLLGRLIEGALGALNTSVPVAGSTVSIPALVWAVVIGTIATVVAAVVPAVRACRVPPIEAVGHGASPVPRTGAQSLVRTAIVAVVVGLAAALLVSRGEAGLNPVSLGLGVAVAVMVLGSTPLLLAGLVSGFVGVLPLRPPALRTIAARDVARHRSRTAATAAALILATAVVSGLAVFLSSFSHSVDGQVRDLVRADLVVDSGTFTKGGLPEDLVAQISGLEPVTAASGWQIGRGWVGARPVRMTGFDMARFGELMNPTWVGPAPGPLDESSVLVSSRLADEIGLQVGASVPVTFTSTGAENLRVAGVYRSGELLLGDMVLDRAVLSRQVPATTDIAALVALSPDDAATRAQVEELASRSGVSSVLRPDAFVERRSEVLTGFQRVIEWMLLFTLVQALIGVVNTLLLSVGERRRELGLLRASGATRRQVLRMVLGEGVALALVGTFVGLVVGLVGARLGVAALASLGVTSFAVPVGGVALVGVAAATLGVLATVAPARWASAVPPLEAVFDDGDLRSRPRRAQRPRLHRMGKAAFHWTGDADLITDPATPPSAAFPPLPTGRGVQLPTVPPPLPPHMVIPPPPATSAGGPVVPRAPGRHRCLCLRRCPAPSRWPRWLRGRPLPPLRRRRRPRSNGRSRRRLRSFPFPRALFPRACRRRRPNPSRSSRRAGPTWVPTDRRDAGSGRRVGGARRGPPVDAAPAPRPTALRVGPRLRPNLRSRSSLPRRSSRQVPLWVSTVARPDNTSVRDLRTGGRSRTRRRPDRPSGPDRSPGSRPRRASASAAARPERQPVTAASRPVGPDRSGAERPDGTPGAVRAAPAARAAQASARVLPAMVGPTRWPWRWDGSTRGRWPRRRRRCG